MAPLRVQPPDIAIGDNRSVGRAPSPASPPRSGSQARCRSVMLIPKMPKSTKPPVRATRAKAEVQQEFTGIRREAEAARESADPKAEEAARLRAAEVRHAVEGNTVEGVVQRVSGLGLEISKALADVSAKLVEEVERLSAVREAVNLERAELERLHKIDVAATALDQMAADPKAEEAARLRAAEVRQAVEGTTVEGVVQGISGLGLEISKALADLSGKLVEEVEQLSAAREAVNLERTELERLHKIDVAATALDQMVQDYAREKERLEAEIAAQRAAWEEESRDGERERKEQEENLKKARAREIEEYEYKKNLERKKALDKYEEDQRLQEKKNKERQETLEKSWQQRETALKEQEQELLRLRKEAQDFPETVKTESDKAAVLASKAAGQKFEQEILLLKKEADTEKRLASLQVKTLEDTITRQAAQIEALQKQADEAKQQVQDIAVKAIEGASGAKALAHINQIAMEQAKRPQQ